MRFSFQSGVRNDLLQEIADQTKSHVINRNGLLVPIGYNGQVAPHTSIVRITYTVPANRYGIISHLSMGLNRHLAPTTAALSGLVFRIKPAASPSVDVGNVQMNQSAVGSENHIALNHGGIIEEGDKIEVATFDTSTGGSINYNCGILINEFDI